MNILDKIVKHKKSEVNDLKSKYSFNDLESSALFEKETNSLKENLILSKSGIIAEHKRKSPSKSIINDNSIINNIIKGYQDAKVCGISVLTDFTFFGGSSNDLKIAREIFSGPILRKEFIIDEFQIVESKSMGADVILLIASLLSPKEIKTFSNLAKRLNLEVLVEIHNYEELKKALNNCVDMIGVNNRNLKTFKTDIDISKKLSEKIPDEFFKISESGIDDYNKIIDLRNIGYRGFLIGEYFMDSKDPGFVAREFIKKIEQ